MIIVTGAAGFIGSSLVSMLNAAGYNDIVVVDDFSTSEKEPNLQGKKISAKVERSQFKEWLNENHRLIQFIFHLGARTDTTEFNKEIFDELNLNYSKDVWNACVEFGLPLVYASSAATYGAGEHGYVDSHEIVEKLKPLNPYGDSKNDFDKWALAQGNKPYFWAGLKFFNVYGPNEYHKKRMASVVFHSYNQIKDAGKVKLFRSHRPDFKDGEQLRDFVYVKDVADVCLFFMTTRKKSGIYNLGSGKARPFNDLVNTLFDELGVQRNIEYVDTPLDIRDKYQYYTEADMSKLRKAGYEKPFHTLEEGIKDYVSYLKKGSYL